MLGICIFFEFDIYLGYCKGNCVIEFFFDVQFYWVVVLWVGWWWGVDMFVGLFLFFDGFEYVFFVVNLEIMCVDDLLLVLLYLFVKIEIFNW